MTPSHWSALTGRHQGREILLITFIAIVVIVVTNLNNISVSRQGRSSKHVGKHKKALVIRPVRTDTDGDESNTTEHRKRKRRYRPHYPRLSTLAKNNKLWSTDSIASLGMSERIGIQLNDSLVEAQAPICFSTAISENITERYIQPPEIKPSCRVAIHANPNCNNIHAIDVRHSLHNDLFRKISKGDVRNVWSVLEEHKRRSVPKLWEEQNVGFAMKTLRWARDFLRQTYTLQQKEAVALDYLSHTPYVTSMYGFCGLTSLNSYANQGDLSSFLRRRLRASKNASSTESLAIASRLARSIAGMQTREVSIMGGGYSGKKSLLIIHRDIGASNVLLSQSAGGLDLFLDDFNKAYVIRRYDKNFPSQNQMCTFRDRYVCGEDGRRPDTRSPEECKGNQSLTHGIDTHGMGTVLFYLLTMRRAHNLDSGAPGRAEDHIEWYREQVKKGAKAEIPEKLASTTDQAIKAIINAMRMSMTADAKERPNATEIADYLDDQYSKYFEASAKRKALRQTFLNRSTTSNTL